MVLAGCMGRNLFFKMLSSRTVYHFSGSGYGLETKQAVVKSGGEMNIRPPM